MLNKPSPQVLAALASLQGTPDFETVLAWLSDSRQTLYADACRTKEDVLCRWQQGAAQAVDEFLNKVNTAQDVLRKSR